MSEKYEEDSNSVKAESNHSHSPQDDNTSLSVGSKNISKSLDSESGKGRSINQESGESKNVSESLNSELEEEKSDNQESEEEKSDNQESEEEKSDNQESEEEKSDNQEVYPPKKVYIETFKVEDTAPNILISKAPSRPQQLNASNKKIFYKLGKNPASVVCKFCNSRIKTKTSKMVKASAIACCIILCCICPILSFLPFCGKKRWYYINHYCPECSKYLGNY